MLQRKFAERALGIGAQTAQVQCLIALSNEALQQGRNDSLGSEAVGQERKAQAHAIAEAPPAQCGTKSRDSLGSGDATSAGLTSPSITRAA
jgi:hypothetical protein